MKKEQNMEKQTICRQFEGTVVGDGAEKTILVRVESIKTHPKYRKQYKTHKSYAVHDEKNEAEIGSKVLFQECRPISKTKRWRLISIVKKAA